MDLKAARFLGDGISMYNNMKLVSCVLLCLFQVRPRGMETARLSVPSGRKNRTREAYMCDILSHISPEQRPSRYWQTTVHDPVLLDVLSRHQYLAQNVASHLYRNVSRESE